MHPLAFRLATEVTLVHLDPATKHGFAFSFQLPSDDRGKPKNKECGCFKVHATEAGCRQGGRS